MRHGGRRIHEPMIFFSLTFAKWGEFGEFGTLGRVG